MAASEVALLLHSTLSVPRVQGREYQEVGLLQDHLGGWLPQARHSPPLGPLPCLPHPFLLPLFLGCGSRRGGRNDVLSARVPILFWGRLVALSGGSSLAQRSTAFSLSCVSFLALCGRLLLCERGSWCFESWSNYPQRDVLYGGEAAESEVLLVGSVSPFLLAVLGMGQKALEPWLQTAQQHS